MTNEENILIQEDFEVWKAEDNDVMISFIGRMKLPEVTFAILEGNHLTILENGGEPALRFIELTEEVTEWIKEAETVYLTRVFNEKMHLSVLQVQTA